MSFQQAAAELNVTPAALSFQIKSLEDHFGGPLFIRHNRAVELTEAGRALAPGAKDGFEALAAAWRAARRVSDHSSLTVTTGPSFTAVWLAPRLYSFAKAHPEIDRIEFYDDRVDNLTAVAVVAERAGVAFVSVLVQGGKGWQR